MLDSTTYLKVSCSLDALAAMYGTPHSGLAEVSCESALPLVYLSDITAHIKEASACRWNAGAAGEEP